jgi:DNA methyltransferase 1-associated protein 1
MGDVANILGITPNSSNNKGRINAGLNNRNFPTIKDAPASHSIPRSIQSTSAILNKPVLKILAGKEEAKNYTSSSTLPPIAPSTNIPTQRGRHGLGESKESDRDTLTQDSFVKINNKYISTKKARSWVFAPFSNSARKDGLLLHHWVRAGVEYPEYPYARFDVHLEELSYANVVLEIEKEAAANGPKGPNSSNNPAIRSEEEINAVADLFYKQYLHDDSWTQSETDALLEFCRVYELRWPVIIDRWIGKFGSMSSKKVEDLQHRYYTIGYVMNRMKVERAAKLEAENLAKAMAAANQNITSTPVVVGTISAPSAVVNSVSKESKENCTIKAENALASAIASSSSTAITSLIGDVKANLQPPISVTGTGTSNQPTFDLQAERQRRKVMDMLWARTKEEELEEIELRHELKLIETQIRKLKKSGGHILAAASAAKNGNTTGGVIHKQSVSSGIGNGETSQTPSPEDIVNAQFATLTPTPTSGTPYLQSGRQQPPPTGGQMGINKTTLKRLQQMLQEMKVNENPIPTKQVCDLYDQVRKYSLILLTLQKIMLKKENEVVNKRLRLEKVAVDVVQQQEVAATAAANAVAAAAAAASQQAAAAAAAKEKAASTNSKSNAKGSSSGSKNNGGSGSISGGGKGSGSTSGSKKVSSKSSGKSGGGKSKKKKKPSSSGEGGGGATKKRKTTKKSKDDSKKSAASKVAAASGATKVSGTTKASGTTKVSGTTKAPGATKAPATGSASVAIISSIRSDDAVNPMPTIPKNLTTAPAAGATTAISQQAPNVIIGGIPPPPASRIGSIPRDANGKATKKRVKKNSQPQKQQPSPKKQQPSQQQNVTEKK